MSDQLKPGDQVSFLNYEGGGQIIAIVDDQNLMLELDDGLEMPVNRNEVVKNRDFTVSQPEPEPSLETPQATETTQSSSDEPYGAYLAFDKHKSQEILDLYMINHGYFSLYFQVFEQPNDGSYRGLSRGELSPFGYQLLNRYHTSEFEAWPTIVVQGLFYTDRTETLPEPFIYNFKPKAKAFFKAVRTAPVLDTPAHLFQVNQAKPRLSAEDLDQKTVNPDPTLKAEPETQEAKVHMDQPPEVVDLHIDRLVPNYKEMERQAILDYQLNYFEQNLDKAIAHHYQRIIFIHGVGNGVLRERVHGKLKQKPEVRSYKEADNQQYGYGATEVRFHQNL